MENNRTRIDQTLDRAAPPHCGVVGGLVRLLHFYGEPRSESDLLLSLAKVPRGLQVKLSTFVCRKLNGIRPTVERHLLQIDEFLPEKAYDCWRVYNNILVPNLPNGKCFDPSDKFKVML